MSDFGVVLQGKDNMEEILKSQHLKLFEHNAGTGSGSSARGGAAGQGAGETPSDP